MRVVAVVPLTIEQEVQAVLAVVDLVLQIQLHLPLELLTQAVAVVEVVKIMQVAQEVQE
jgi:hypothetical protein